MPTKQHLSPTHPAFFFFTILKLYLCIAFFFSQSIHAQYDPIHNPIFDGLTDLFSLQELPEENAFPDHILLYEYEQNEPLELDIPDTPDLSEQSLEIQRRLNQQPIDTHYLIATPEDDREQIAFKQSIERIQTRNQERTRELAQARRRAQIQALVRNKAQTRVLTRAQTRAQGHTNTQAQVDTRTQQEQAQINARIKTRKRERARARAQKIKCYYCTRPFPNLAAVHMHINKSHGLKTYHHCKICDLLFSKHVFYTQHMKSKHKTAPAPVSVFFSAKKPNNLAQ